MLIPRWLVMLFLGGMAALLLGVGIGLGAVGTDGFVSSTVQQEQLVFFGSGLMCVIAALLALHTTWRKGRAEWAFDNITLEWDPHALRPGHRADLTIHLDPSGTVDLERIDVELVGLEPDYSGRAGTYERVVETVDLEGVHEAREQLTDGDSCTVTGTFEIPSEPERLHGEYEPLTWRLRVTVDPFDAGEVRRVHNLSVERAAPPRFAPRSRRPITAGRRRDWRPPRSGRRSSESRWSSNHSGTV